MGSFKWNGSTDPEDKSGTAEYVRGDKVISVKLESFKLACELDKFIDKQYKRGYTNALLSELTNTEIRLNRLIIDNGD